ncbi:MAG: hypothetical protein MJZ02_02065, partial [Paludibacteraceae bacterium]|nr:hypothetical protein [Paludibacteraceae bacterium]
MKSKSENSFFKMLKNRHFLIAVLISAMQCCFQSVFAEDTEIEVSGFSVQIYNGAEHNPEDIIVTYNGSELEKGSDYELEFSDNINAGTAKVSVKPIGASTFTQKTVEFTINPAVITVTGGTASK